MKLLQNKRWSYDRLTDDSGTVWKIHKAAQCEGDFCAIHNPSDHPLKAAKLAMRTDPFKYGFVERFCEHGIGHSDPDSTAYFARIGAAGMGVHGCDGCCTARYEETQGLQTQHDLHELEGIEDPFCIDCNPFGLDYEDIH